MKFQRGGNEFVFVLDHFLNSCGCSTAKSKTPRQETIFLPTYRYRAWVQPSLTTRDRAARNGETCSCWVLRPNLCELGVCILCYWFTYHLLLPNFILAILMHAQVYGITRVHEFHIYSSRTEWNLLSSLIVYGDGICKQRAVNLNFKLLLFHFIFFSFTSESS